MLENKINEIRSRSDIVDIISSYIPLTKKGKNYFGVCPFHDDTNPSMSVSKEKQIYKCFSCGASGNVINFVMDYEHLDFKDAISLLAQKAGIEFKNTNVKTTNKYEKYYNMYDISLKMYQNNLNSSLGKSAREYLLKRGIDEEIIKTFKIGLSTSDRNNLTKILNSKGYTNKEIETYGLGTNNHDLYVNRIMFPLFDVSNKPVGFSGRIYNTNSDSKYINTKETPIFKKGENLYNYYNAKDRVRIEKKLILVEGFMDVIRLHTIGIENVVALMGTSLTKEQISLLRRLTNNIYISLDGDAPGQKAIYNVGKELELNNFNVFVIKLTDGLDPDEYILKEGKKSYLSLYNNPLSFSDFKIKYLKEGKDLTNIDEKAEYINEVLQEIKNEEDIVKQELLLKKISLEFNIDIEILKKKLQNVQKYSKIETLKKEPPKQEKINKYQKATYELLNYMLNSYEVTKIYETKLNYMPYKEARFLANEIIYYYKKHGSLLLADFITSLNDKKPLEDYLKEVLKYEINENPNFSVIDEYISVIKEYNKSQEIKRLNEMLKKELDIEKQIAIAEKIRLLKIGDESND